MRDSTIIVKMPSIVPIGAKRHRTQAITKENQYLFLFLINRPEAITPTAIASPSKKQNIPKAANKYPNALGDKSPETVTDSGDLTMFIPAHI